MNDYSAFEREPTADSIKKLQNLADKWQDLDERIEAKQKELEELNQEKTDLRDRIMADALGNFEGKFNLKDGRFIESKSGIKASIAEKHGRKDEALTWLVDNGYGAIVKTDFSFSFGKDTAEKQSAFKEQIPQIEKNIDFRLDFKEKRGVHPATLSVWAKEQLEEGVELPHELLGIHNFRTIKLIV